MRGRVVVGCFSSNVTNAHTGEIAVKTGRYLGVLGRSALGMARCARRIGYYLPSSSYPSGHLQYLPPSEVLAVATGVKVSGVGAA